MRHLPVSALLASLLLVLALPPAGASHVHPSDIRWACGGGATPAQDCGINAIHDPTFTTKSWISDNDKVIGVEIGGDARAYPTKMLDNHEIVTDTVGGNRIAVTWCPLCGSAIVFDRVVNHPDGRLLVTFDVSGYLYKHDLVMYDSQTETLWTQVEGVPIATWEGRVDNDHYEATLRAIPSELTTWSDWRQRHPDTKLLSNEGRTYGGAYAGYGDNCRFGISSTSNCNITGLHPKEQMIGVDIATGTKAFPIFGVRAEGGVVQEPIGATDAVIVANRGGASWVYDSGGHTFTKRGDQWVDETGAAWDLEKGARTDGTDRLTALDHRVMFWFAWETHHPDTGLWLPDGADGGKPLSGEGAGIPAPGWGLGVALFVAMAAFARGTRRRQG